MKRLLILFIVLIMLIGATSVYATEKSTSVYVEYASSSASVPSHSGAGGGGTITFDSSGNSSSQNAVVNQKLYEGETIKTQPYETIFFGCENENYADVVMLYAAVVFSDGTKITSDKLAFQDNDGNSRSNRLSLTDKEGQGKFIVYVKYANSEMDEFEFPIIISNEAEQGYFDLKVTGEHIRRSADVNVFNCIFFREGLNPVKLQSSVGVRVTDSQDNDCLVNNSFDTTTAMAFGLDISRSNANETFTLFIPSGIMSDVFSNAVNNEFSYSFTLPNLDLRPENFIESTFPADGDIYYIAQNGEILNVTIKLQKGYSIADISKLSTDNLDVVGDITIINEAGQYIITLPLRVKDGEHYAIPLYTGLATTSDGKIQSGNTQISFSIMLRENVDLPDEAVFYDVHPNHWAFNVVSNLVLRGIISGYPDGTFKPEANVTRAEAAKMIVTAFSINGQNGKTYGDISGHWAEDYIKNLDGAMPLKIDVVDFKPDDFATREEIVATLVNVLNLANSDISIEADSIGDIDKIRSDLIEKFIIGIDNGIIKGYEDSTFRPWENITRAEMAMMIYRVIE